jgi:hypothetical protein
VLTSGSRPVMLSRSEWARDELPWERTNVMSCRGSGRTPGGQHGGRNAGADCAPA